MDYRRRIRVDVVHNFGGGYMATRKVALNFRTIGVGDTVALAGNPAYKGKVKEYLGYKITPEFKGRTYRIAWVQPTKASSTHFDFELVKTKGRLKLAKRPK